MELELIIDSETKKCTKCEETYPATEEFFYKQKTHTKKKGSFYKLSSWCKPCTIKNSFQWAKSIDPERRKEYFKKCDSQQYRKELKREYSKKQKESGYYKQYQEDNKDKFSGYGKNRRMNKEHEISETEWFECLDFFNNSCAYCGISEGEAYEKYDQLLHKEHVDHDGANDITNCVPSCKGCNASKHLFSLNEWYNDDNPIYSKRRYNRIVKWILSFAEVNH